MSFRFEHILEADEEDEKPETLKPTILPDIIESLRENVKKVVAEQSEGPTEYIKTFDTFLNLIDGRAEAEIDSYLNQESHTFDEFSGRVKEFDKLSKTLNESLPKEVNLGMFELHCEDIIAGLSRKTGI